MPTSVADDPVLTDLYRQYDEKHEAAQAIVDSVNPSGPMLVKAEKLYDERDAIKVQIIDRQATITRLDALRGKSDSGSQWANTPNRTLPFSASMGDREKAYPGGDGANQFHYGGSTPAGFASFQYDDQRKAWEMIAEAGPGTFGEKKWAMISSFEYKKDWATYLRKGERAIDLHYKTLMEGLDDQGGVFAPAELFARVIGRLPAPTSLRGMVTTLTTGRDMLIMPRKQYSADDKYTTAFRSNWTGEIPADGTGAQSLVDTTNLTGNLEIPVHTAMLAAAVTRNFIEDSAFPLQAWLESELSQVIDLLYEDMIINGTGIGMPSGMLRGAAASNNGTTVNPQYPEVILSESSGAIGPDQLIHIQMAVAPQYEGNARWIMDKRNTYAGINLLKDQQLRPLFTTGYEDSGLVGKRGRILLGDPVVVSLFMPAPSSTTYPLIYGDPKGHYLAQRVGFSIQVLDQTKARANQIELVGRVRFGGLTVEPWRIKIGKSHTS